MLEKMLRDPRLPLSATMVVDNWRDTVVAVLTAPNRMALAMVCSAKDPAGQAVTFVQGGVCVHEAPLRAARREVREEIPSLARQHKKQTVRVQWDRGLYLGSTQIELTRSGTPKRLHFFSLQTTVWNLVPDGKECTGAFWIHDPDVFESILAPTRERNRAKYAAMCAAVYTAQQHGYLL